MTATPADYLAESSSASYQDKNVTADARYFYVITAVNGAGLESPASKEIWAVADNKDHKIILIGNKFDPECGEHVTVKFKAEKSCKVRFRVFSIDGKLVHETENLATEPGEHQREWAGVSNNLTKVTPGVYILQIVLDDQPGSYEKVIISRKKK